MLYSHVETAPLEFVGCGRYRLIAKMTSGGFSQVWRGIDLLTQGPVAVKLEDYEDDLQALQLEDEAALIRSLADAETEEERVHPEGFPKLLYSGDEKHYHVMVMEMLGDAVSLLVEGVGPRPSIGEVGLGMLAEQMICRLAFLHSRGIVHRDVKPENFLFGRGPKAGHVYLVDFGLSRRFVEQGKHIPKRTGCSMAGTMRYASVNVMKGVLPSRRDDLESLGYVLVYLAQGYLPWSGLGPFPGDDLREMRWRILEKKEATTLDMLCDGLPPGIESYLREVRDLRYDEEPDYERLHRHLSSMRGAAADGSCLPWLKGVPGLVPAPAKLPQQPKCVASDDSPKSPWNVLTAAICGACSCQDPTPPIKIDADETFWGSASDESCSSTSSSSRSM